MFQLEIFEYNSSNVEINTIYSNVFHNKNQNDTNEASESLSTEENIEIKFLKMKNCLRFPLITQYLDIVKDTSKKEFINKISSSSFLNSIIDTKLNEKTYFKQDEIIKIAYQTLLALNYFEKNGIILRYLEPKRILLNSDNSLKLRNYISDIMFSPQQLKYINNFRYLAPELIFYNEINHNIRSAIWSLGIILLELCLNIQNISLYEDFFKYLGTNNFIKDYIELLEKYKESSVFNKLEKTFDPNYKDSKRLLECFLNGDLSKKSEVSVEFKDFIQNCLYVDPSKRKDSQTLLQHKLFAHLNASSFIKSVNYICPIDKDVIVGFYSKEEIKQKQASSSDNYEIFKNVFKIDLLLFLKKKGIIDYKPKILKIPSYFRFSQDCFNNTQNIMNQTNVKSEFEKLFESEQNDQIYYGNLITIGNYIINLPSDYEKENLILENFLKNSIFDMQLISSDKYSSNISDDSSEMSVKDTVSVKSSDSKLVSSKINNSEKKKEINYYFKLKNIVSNILSQNNQFKKEELLSEIKKNNYYVPTNLRSIIYRIILEVDLINENDTIELSSLYENHSFSSSEMKQITKDILRCEDYDPLFKTKEGKINLKRMFQALIYNQEEFFYVQGMESICSAFAKLFYPSLDTTYQVFFKFIKKMLFQFFDTYKKSINDLAFNHLVLGRLLAFFDPELYLYLKEIAILDEQFSANWILTLFSQSFKFESLFKLWDLFLIENINVFYLVIIYIFKHNRTIILESNKEFILSGFKEMTEYLNTEKIVAEVIQMKKLIPDSLVPIVSDYSEEIVSELSKSDYFKNRWWDLTNFNTDKYMLPIVNLDDVLTNIQNVCFIDVRLKADYESRKIKESINFNLNQKMNVEGLVKTFHNLNNSQKVLVVVGDKRTDYFDICQVLLKNKIKYLMILKGGIDIVYTDENSLIEKMKK